MKTENSTGRFPNLKRLVDKSEISDSGFRQKCLSEVSKRFSNARGNDLFAVRVVDWFYGEKVRDNDIVICESGMTASFDDFDSDSDLSLGERGWNTVVRIYVNNQDEEHCK